MLRTWRARRQLSQLDLALQAGVSQRHLSFVEIGRANPSRELVLQLASQLHIPLRERNVLLLASGYAPVYPETPLEAEALLPVRLALEKLLSSHRPFPAFVVDRCWGLVSANRPAWDFLTAGVAPELLTPPVNTMRVGLHPDGLAPRILNLPEYAAYLLARLQRQAALAPDPAVAALYDEIRGYSTVSESLRARSIRLPENMLFAPLHLRTLDGREVTFFSSIATFGTAADITLAELSIEQFFPADKITDAALRAAYP